MPTKAEVMTRVAERFGDVLEDAFASGLNADEAHLCITKAAMDALINGDTRGNTEKHTAARAAFDEQEGARRPRSEAH